MHIKNITKNYSLLNVLIGEFYVVENVDFSRLKGSFKLQTKKMSHFEGEFCDIN